MRASERAYGDLREEILRWQLPSGAVLAEEELAERLGMSRTPVREALGRLVADGLVVPERGRGLVVAPMELSDVEALYELREALETQAARLAARKADRAVFAEVAAAFDGPVVSTEAGRDAYYALIARFDREIDLAVANAFLVTALASVRTHLARVRRAARDNPPRLIASAAEHRIIAAAIAAGDADLAAHATHVHLHNSLQNVLATASLGADALARTA